MANTPRVDEECMKLVDEIVHEAHVECLVETMRRGLEAPLAMGITANALLSEAVLVMHRAHVEVPAATSLSKQTLHDHIDEMWKALEPQGVPS